MKTIDLNCDMGEGYGAWQMGDDRGLMPLISSANVACGYHVGDPSTIRATVRLAVDHGVAVGAHPSLPDLQGFGPARDEDLRAGVLRPRAVPVGRGRGVCARRGNPPAS